MILQVVETTHKDQAWSRRSIGSKKACYSRRPPRQLRVRATEEILESAPQRRPHGTSSSTCRLLHAPAATRLLPHLIADACLIFPLPFGETGATTAAGAEGGSGRGDGRRMWRLGLVWGLRCFPSGGDTGG
jgi:hypothetical protein